MINLHARLAARDERGAVLPLTIAVAALVFLLASVLLASTLMGAKSADASRQSVRTLTEAESGRDVALASILDRTCRPSVTETKYQYVVKSFASDVMPPAATVAEASPSCPTPDDKWVIVTTKVPQGKSGFFTITSTYGFEAASSLSAQLSAKNAIASKSSVILQANVRPVAGALKTMDIASAGEGRYNATTGDIYCSKPSTALLKIQAKVKTFDDGWSQRSVFGGCQFEEPVELSGGLEAIGGTVFNNGLCMVKGGTGPTGPVPATACPGLQAGADEQFFTWNPDIEALRNTVWDSDKYCKNLMTSGAETAVRGFAIDAITSATEPLVIDARSCSDISFLKTVSLTLPQNVTIFARAFDINQLSLRSTDSTKRNFNFVSTETRCSAASAYPDAFELHATRLRYAVGVSSYFYSTCGATVSGKASGQIYGGRSATVANDNTLSFTDNVFTYQPVELPGVTGSVAVRGAKFYMVSQVETKG